jgi:hypothetical protein
MQLCDFFLQKRSQVSAAAYDSSLRVVACHFNKQVPAAAASAKRTIEASPDLLCFN